MKILKFFLFLLLFVALAFAIIAFTGAKDYRVERSVEINANDSIVFNLVSNYSNWDQWSPWKELDPASQYSIDGEDGTMGAVYNWSGGDPNLTGTGSMTTKSLIPKTLFSYDLHFTEPQDMKSNGGFTLEALSEKRTKLTWYDQGDIPAMQRPFMLFFDLEEMLGKNFERGLFKIDSLASYAQNTILLEQGAQ